ncbi:LVIVD repeat-containing protein [Roseivirga misakiensis]|uniref:LVIVD repeat-containing protein n=1 Tax=Roseivirga misakiensis TaxID=1563681 RepID=A0A1E5T0M3_9BACT|nr:hypothetical protein [Roseivirga misakiensis]OEK04857.1 hypothetical protein BFP71_15575 [Roseivirga misakiensis]
MKRSLYPISILILLLCFSCIESSLPEFPQGEVVGYKPVYLTDPENAIELVAARPIENPGQIYLLGDLLLMNDVGKGIHVIDNADPTNPLARGFLTVQGSENMVLRDGIVYVNQFNSLLAIDVSDTENVQVISRNEDVLSTNGEETVVPPLEGYFFECVDFSKGKIIGWVLTTIEAPKCFR